VRLILKGGLALVVLQLQALRLLPRTVSSILGNIRPDRLSDVDFTLLIGGVNSPRWLAIEEDFDRLHARCSQLVQQALLRWVRDTEAGLAIGEGRLQNFSDLFDEATGSKRQNLGKDLARRLNEATSLVRDELQQTLRDSGLALDGKHELRKLSTRSPESHGSVRHMSIEDATAVHVDFARLDHLLGRALVFPEQLGPRDEPGVLPACRPELMRVDPSPEAAQGQVLLEYTGPDRCLFVSYNSGVAFHNQGVDNLFTLIRVFLPFRLRLPDMPPKLLEELEEETQDGPPLSWSRGEIIDISVPSFRDGQRKLFLEREEGCPTAFAHPAAFVCEGEEWCKIHVESLDSLLLEQRDLTFGPKMQQLLIWRVGKVSKRLGRLVDLLGIKAIVKENCDWSKKADSFEELAERLVKFAQQELRPSLEASRGVKRRASELMSPTSVPKRRRSSVVPDSSPSGLFSSVFTGARSVFRCMTGTPWKYRRRSSIHSMRRSSVHSLHRGSDANLIGRRRRWRLAFAKQCRARLLRPLSLVNVASILGSPTPATGRAKTVSDFSGCGRPSMSTTDALFDAVGVQRLLLDPLEQLTLKVFSQTVRDTLPKDFVGRWNEMLGPLARRARLFAVAFRDLAERGMNPPGEEALYRFEFGGSWNLRGAS